MIDFSYLGEKVKNSPFLNSPYKHIYIENFLEDKHFQEIITSFEIESPKNINDDKELIDGLKDKGFKSISFPGAVTNVDEYLQWKKNGKISKHMNSSCEGFGFVMRLYEIKTQILNSLNDYISGKEFNKILADKFDIESFKELVIDGGIQKYLDGYEISPHPDTRRKAITFMVNINPSNQSESMNHHTNYMSLIDERKYVKEFWEGNPEIDRVWLPWKWLKNEFTQNKNNSIVIFSPDNNTFHSVRAEYNHFTTQRTQLYGNLWYKNSIDKSISWEDLDLISKSTLPKKTMRNKITSLLPNSVKQNLKKILYKDSDTRERKI
tara:strand:+ start:1014 stop:1979 length:966 start_codon:yes stop_codon:yes gene_type:complete